VHDQGVEWKEIAGKAAIVERLHERGNDAGVVAPEVKVLRWREARCFEHGDVADSLRPINGTVLDHEVDRIHLIVGEWRRHSTRARRGVEDKVPSPNRHQ
jgi:hypothetical protein